LRCALVPADPGKKVYLAAATYFATRPPEVALAPLERLLAWSKRVQKTEWDRDGVQEIVKGYRARLVP
jgi:hypothetical protein